MAAANWVLCLFVIGVNCDSCLLAAVDFVWQFLRLGRLAVLVCYWLVFRCVDMVFFFA